MTGEFSPSPQQAAAMAGFCEWFRHGAAAQQVFRVFGYAGSGKTTLTRYAIGELGLGEGEVVYAAYTGKAALVMTRKGTPASTIHSLIYKVAPPAAEHIREIREEVREIEAGLAGMPAAERALAEVKLKHLRLSLDDAHKPRFVLNEESAAKRARLIVLDEVSMVGADLAQDLLAFGRPILVLGDPGQLPPIDGEGFFTEATPDVMLTEVHRQAAESAIIRLATMARQGERIPYRAHDSEVAKVRAHELEPGHFRAADQVICGRNATRNAINAMMLQEHGFAGVYPSGKGEKIICLKNRAGAGVVNGMFLELSEIEECDRYAFSALVRREDDPPDAPPVRHEIYKGHFEDAVALDPDRGRRDFQVKRALIEAVWGYAITCHKAQGSQWERVIVVDDGLGRTAEERARWLYTAITRAERGLLILE